MPQRLKPPYKYFGFARLKPCSACSFLRPISSGATSSVRRWVLALFAFLIAIAAGAANPFQSATNAELNKQLGQPLWAGLSVYVTGLLGLLLVQMIVRQPLPADKLDAVHWWSWIGGLISILATMAGLLLAQKLGSGMFTGLSVTASLVTSVLLDHFGLLGLKQHTASPGRLAGCVLLVAGVWLVAKF